MGKSEYIQKGFRISENNPVVAVIAWKISVYKDADYGSSFNAWKHGHSRRSSRFRFMAREALPSAQSWTGKLIFYRLERCLKTAGSTPNTDIEGSMLLFTIGQKKERRFGAVSL